MATSSFQIDTSPALIKAHAVHGETGYGLRIPHANFFRTLIHTTIMPKPYYADFDLINLSAQFFPILADSGSKTGNTDEAHTQKAQLGTFRMDQGE